MKTDKKNGEIDINDVSITLEVDSVLIANVRSGDVRYVGVELKEDNQHLILENGKGCLILNVEELPDMFYGCYMYNDGVFPYVIKKELEYIVLSDGKNECLTRIVDVHTEVGTRFNYQGAGKPIVEDPNGDSCVWEVYFEVVPVPSEPRHYLLRWNPAISSFKEKDYEKCVANMKFGMFYMNWSIYEWEEARRGDYFYMMRTGDDKAGIVFRGQFLSDPYPSEDWGGSTKRRMYVDVVCMKPEEPGKKPHVSLEELQKVIPSFDWTKGHSGTLLSEDVVTELNNLLQ